MENKIDKLKNNLREMNKDEIINLILNCCSENDNFLNIIKKNINPQVANPSTNNRINFDLQKSSVKNQVSQFMT